MKIISGIRAMQRYADRLRQQHKTIGFVPTMGYLHAGHLSLVKRAKTKSDVVVVSIFVNPTQFAPGEDFKKYPRDRSRDIRRLKQQGLCQVLFIPTAKALYPENFSIYVTETRLNRGLCATFRPTHFRGVTTIVEKLFNIVKPHYAVFGQKDYQQAAILQRLVRDLNNDITIIVAPTMRESDGLAMSSRNKYLSPLERQESLVLHQALIQGKELIEKRKVRDAKSVLATMRQLIRTKRHVKPQYMAVVDARELTPLKKIRGTAVIAVAAYVGKTRLIDNIKIKAD